MDPRKSEAEDLLEEEWVEEEEEEESRRCSERAVGSHVEER